MLPDGDENALCIIIKDSTANANVAGAPAYVRVPAEKCCEHCGKLSTNIIAASQPKGLRVLRCSDERIVRRVPLVPTSEHFFKTQICYRYTKEAGNMLRFFGCSHANRYQPKLNDLQAYTREEVESVSRECLTGVADKKNNTTFGFDGCSRCERPHAKQFYRKFSRR